MESGIEEDRRAWRATVRVSLEMEAQSRLCNNFDMASELDRPIFSFFLPASLHVP